jgi:hypothetical protein
MILGDDFVDLIVWIVSSSEQEAKVLKDEQKKNEVKSTIFVLTGKCCGCCFHCPNVVCDSYEQYIFCKTCGIASCYNNKKFDASMCYSDCFNCTNIGCVYNLRFDIKAIIKNI